MKYCYLFLILFICLSAKAFAAAYPNITIDNQSSSTLYFHYQYGNDEQSFSGDIKTIKILSKKQFEFPLPFTNNQVVNYDEISLKTWISMSDNKYCLPEGSCSRAIEINSSNLYSPCPMSDPVDLDLMYGQVSSNTWQYQPFADQKLLYYPKISKPSAQQCSSEKDPYVPTLFLIVDNAKAVALKVQSKQLYYSLPNAKNKCLNEQCPLDYVEVTLGKKLIDDSAQGLVTWGKSDKIRHNQESLQYFFIPENIKAVNIYLTLFADIFDKQQIDQLTHAKLIPVYQNQSALLLLDLLKAGLVINLGKPHVLIDLYPKAYHLHPESRFVDAYIN